MGAPTEGSVVLVRFPFSDLTQVKLRPAVVLAFAERGDWVLCQVASNGYGDPKAQELMDDDFASGGLRTVSYVRPAKLFTAHESLLVTEVGRLQPNAFRRIRKSVVALFK